MSLILFVHEYLYYIGDGRHYHTTPIDASLNDTRLIACLQSIDTVIPFQEGDMRIEVRLPTDDVYPDIIASIRWSLARRLMSVERVNFLRTLNQYTIIPTDIAEDIVRTHAVWRQEGHRPTNRYRTARIGVHVDDHGGFLVVASHERNSVVGTTYEIYYWTRTDEIAQYTNQMILKRDQDPRDPKSNECTFVVHIATHEHITRVERERWMIDAINSLDCVIDSVCGTPDSMTDNRWEAVFGRVRCVRAPVSIYEDFVVYTESDIISGQRQSPVLRFVAAVNLTVLRGVNDQIVPRMMRAYYCCMYPSVPYPRVQDGHRDDTKIFIGIDVSSNAVAVCLLPANRTAPEYTYIWCNKVAVTTAFMAQNRIGSCFEFVDAVPRDFQRIVDYIVTKTRNMTIVHIGIEQELVEGPRVDQEQSRTTKRLAYLVNRAYPNKTTRVSVHHARRGFMHNIGTTISPGTLHHAYHLKSHSNNVHGDPSQHPLSDLIAAFVVSYWIRDFVQYRLDPLDIA